MQLSINLAKVHPAVRQSIIKGLQHEDRARHALGVVEQLRMKRMMDQVVQPGFNTEIGRSSMIISEDQYQRAQSLYGELCFADPEFGKWLLKMNPEFCVKDVGTRVQSGWTPASGGQRSEAGGQNGKSPKLEIRNPKP